MREFLDTSVLVAAFWGGHSHHRSSIEILSRADQAHSCCGLHSCAELYATMTSLPVRPAILPEQALLFVQEVRQRLMLVTLDESEYLQVIENASDRRLTSGRIYDALLLKCAAKSQAESIYTWNSKDFRFIAPSLAERIRTP